MKLKDIKTNKGQQELFKALVRWSVEQNNFTSLTELLNNSETLEFIKDYIDDKDGYPELPFTRFYADCIGSGCPINWGDML